jgi:hypothetical protein
MIAALQLRLDEISEKGLARLVHIDRLLKYNLDPLQPRGRGDDTTAGCFGDEMERHLVSAVRIRGD